MEFPHLQTIYEKYKDRGLSVVAINVVPEQNALLPEWLQQHGSTFPVLKSGENDNLAGRYRISATPLNFILDSDRKVFVRIDGFQPGTEERFARYIESLLEKAG